MASLKTGLRHCSQLSYGSSSSDKISKEAKWTERLSDRADLRKTMQQRLVKPCGFERYVPPKHDPLSRPGSQKGSQIGSQMRSQMGSQMGCQMGSQTGSQMGSQKGSQEPKESHKNAKQAARPNYSKGMQKLHASLFRALENIQHLGSLLYSSIELKFRSIHYFKLSN